MPDFLLTVGAEADLVEIAVYTVDTWGVEQARKYEHALTRHFREIADGAIRTKAALTGRDDIRVSRCEHHYVFSVTRDGADRHPGGSARAHGHARPFASPPGIGSVSDHRRIRQR